jgi:hypothetical protein
MLAYLDKMPPDDTGLDEADPPSVYTPSPPTKVLYPFILLRGCGALSHLLQSPQDGSIESEALTRRIKR